MKRSSDRVLTTHVGSLPRPADLLDVVRAKEEGKPIDEKAHAARLREAVADVVRKQIDLGIDIVDDGEYGKPSFVSYVNERLGGFEFDREVPRQSPWAGSREAKSFPEFYGDGHVAARQNHMVCTAPVTYRGMAQLKTDIDNLKAALDGAKPQEAFMPAISPTSAADWQRNGYYKTEEEYLFAIADALREEYEAIVNAGLLLQVDDPHLVTYWIKEPDLTLEQFRKWAQLRVEALNHALRNIAPEKVRHHTCYGINMGPRVHDLELKHIVDLILKIRAGAYSFEAANPRHEHEWKVWEGAKLPAHPRRDQPLDGFGRTSGAGGRAHRSLRQGGGARERHRRRRLRLCDLRRLEGSAPGHRLGEVQVARRRRAARQPAAVGRALSSSRLAQGSDDRRLPRKRAVSER